MILHTWVGGQKAVEQRASRLGDDAGAVGFLGKCDTPFGKGAQSHLVVSHAEYEGGAGGCSNNPAAIP